MSNTKRKKQKTLRAAREKNGSPEEEMHSGCSEQAGRKGQRPEHSRELHSSDCRACEDQSQLQECFSATGASRHWVWLCILSQLKWVGLVGASVTASTNRAKGRLYDFWGYMGSPLSCWNIPSWHLELPWGHQAVRKPKLPPTERPDGQALRLSRAGGKQRRGGRRRSEERKRAMADQPWAASNPHCSSPNHLIKTTWETLSPIPDPQNLWEILKWLM